VSVSFYAKNGFSSNRKYAMRGELAKNKCVYLLLFVATMIESGAPRGRGDLREPPTTEERLNALLERPH
jgi:hypothetical protein